MPFSGTLSPCSTPCGTLLGSRVRRTMTKAVTGCGCREVSCPRAYSPKCVEQVFSEVRMQDLVYPAPESREDGPRGHPPRRPGVYMLWWWIDMRSDERRSVSRRAP